MEVLPANLPVRRVTMAAMTPGDTAGAAVVDSHAWVLLSVSPFSIQFGPRIPISLLIPHSDAGLSAYRELVAYPRAGTKAKGEVPPDRGKIDMRSLEHAAVADFGVWQP